MRNVGQRVFWLVFLGGLLLFASAIVWYTQRALAPYPPAQAALEALASDAKVRVMETPYGWVFIPQEAVKGGLAFYPGGLVEPQAYAPTLRQIAMGGYRVALLRVRFNLAVTEQGKARQAIAEAPPSRGLWGDIAWAAWWLLILPKAAMRLGLWSCGQLIRRTIFLPKTSPPWPYLLSSTG